MIVWCNTLGIKQETKAKCLPQTSFFGREVAGCIPVADSKERGT